MFHNQWSLNGIIQYTALLSRALDGCCGSTIEPKTHRTYISWMALNSYLVIEAGEKRLTWCCTAISFCRMNWSLKRIPRECMLKCPWLRCVMCLVEDSVEWLWYFDGSHALNRSQLCFIFGEIFATVQSVLSITSGIKRKTGFHLKTLHFHTKCYRSIKINNPLLSCCWRLVSTSYTVNKIVFTYARCTRFRQVNQILTSFQCIHTNYSSEQWKSATI